jgi:hypothetical protein
MREAISLMREAIKGHLALERARAGADPPAVPRLTQRSRRACIEREAQLVGRIAATHLIREEARARAVVSIR